MTEHVHTWRKIGFAQFIGNTIRTRSWRCSCCGETKKSERALSSRCITGRNEATLKTRKS